jgi:hypothetical protein
MRVLVACEFSGIVREAFRKRGHDAWSCDLRPSEDESPFHYTGDIRIFDAWMSWDLVIAHPPCTYLCNSGALRLYETGKKRCGIDAERWQEMRTAAEFFRYFLELPIDKIAVENPIIHYHARQIVGRRQDQSIQPYQFGEDASKRTCLWLKGLPKLRPTLYIAPRMVNGKRRWSNQTDSGQNKLTPSATRSDDRARTYQGIADAMAEQWG